MENGFPLPPEERTMTEPAPAKATYRGRVVYIYAFDLAYDMKRTPMKSLLDEPAALFTAETPSKPGPRELLFFRPQMVRLHATEHASPAGQVSVERTVKIFPIGAVTITVRVPFAVESLDALFSYHSLRLDGTALEERVRQLARQVLDEIRPLCIRPVGELPEAEAYTVFCIDGPLGEGQTAQDWLEGHRREVTALLNEEPRPERLSKQEIDESTDLFLTYYDSDLIVVDWDAALIIERHESLDELLHVMELANVQLAELKAYDRILDARLSRSYVDMTTLSRRRNRRLINEFRELRIDLARLGDELSNITKFFGDWHLARIYQQLSRRFHLSDWTRTLAQKLRTLDELYHLLVQDHTNRWMLILEATIVLLFIIDVIIIVTGME